MRLKDIYQKKPVFSLEFFPPKKEEKLPQTFALMRELTELQPDFMTVTYGAGGGTRALTREMVSYIVHRLAVPAVAHLTCVDHSAEDLAGILQMLSAWGIENVLALRGDPAAGQDKFVKHPEGFGSALELVQYIKREYNFSIAVAGYPEVHPDAASADADIDYLKRKVAAGADAVITQLFFDANHYFLFVEKAKKAGIDVPIVPGVMPIRNVAQVEKFTTMCGATIPSPLLADLKKIQENPQEVIAYGTQSAIDLCQKLLAGGAPGIHFYTLNKSRQVKDILSELKKMS